MRWKDVMTTMEDEISDEIGTVRVDVGEVVAEEAENGRTGEIDDMEDARQLVIWTE